MAKMDNLKKRTSDDSAGSALFVCLQQLKEQLDVPDDNAPLSNGVFRRAFSQVFSMLFEHCAGLAKNVADLSEENKSLRSDVQNQRVEIQLLRKQVTSLSSSIYSAGQSSTLANVLIHAVPEAPNESLLDIRRTALKQLRALDNKIDTADIVCVSRLGHMIPKAPTRQRPLVVRLSSPRLCRQLANASYRRFVADKESMRGKPYVTLHNFPGTTSRNSYKASQFKVLMKPDSGERRQTSVGKILRPSV